MSKKKKLIVIPHGGLGNRMRVISSSIQIARENNMKLVIAWSINSALGCDISDIFESIGFEYTVPRRWISKLLIYIYRPGAIKRFYKIYNFFSSLFFSASIFDQDILSTKNNSFETRVKQIKITGNESTILIATCLSFSTKQENINYTEYLKNNSNWELFRKYQLTSILHNEIEGELKQIGRPYIGIHIRRTDHKALIDNSPLENYLIAIDQHLLKDPGQLFFLATDDSQLKMTLKSKYGTSIYTTQVKLGRDDIRGVHGAVIELFLLSKSTSIICSLISSYSATAAVIGQIKEIKYV